MCTLPQNDALQRELDDLRAEKEERERQLQDENADLQGNVAKMRAELEAIMKELQDLMDTKLGLELEIAAYRKLLEGEENRCATRHRPVGDETYTRTLDNAHSSQARGLNLRRGWSLDGKITLTVHINDEHTDGF